MVLGLCQFEATNDIVSAGNDKPDRASDWRRGDCSAPNRRCVFMNWKVKFQQTNARMAFQD